MSGGSYDYAYSKLNDFADSLQLTTPLRKAFKTHLLKVSNACHDIEWVDSCDWSPGDEDEAIRATLGEHANTLVLIEVIADAKRIMAELEAALQATSRR